MATGLLIIEDEPIVNNYLTEKLQDNGYTVQSAFNGKEALKLIQKNVPDLIITDIVMPEMDGIEFCRELRKLDGFNATPIIASTAWASRENELRPFGVRHFIEKPYDVRDLKAMIENILNPPPKLSAPKKILAVGEMVLSAKRAVDELQRDSWPIDFKFLEVTDSQDAVLRDVAAVKADLILLDQSICQLDANKLADGLIQALPDTPVVIYNENRFSEAHHAADLEEQACQGRIIHLEKLTKMNLALIIVKLLKG